MTKVEYNDDVMDELDDLKEDDDVELLDEEFPIEDEEEEVPEPLPGVVHDCMRLNVRALPNTLSNVVTTLINGENVLVDLESSTDEFYRVTTETGVEGFCMAQFIEL